MIATVHSEWIKLRTVRVHAVLVLIAVAFPLIVLVLVAAFTPEVRDVAGSELASVLAFTAVISAILFGTVAAIGTTGEFSHGTIRPTYVATPSHVRVLGAKLVINSLAAAAGMTALIVICWSAAALVVSQRGETASLSLSDGSLGSLIALVALAVALTWFALGISLLVRSSAAAISLLLLWPLFVEGVLSGVLVLVRAESLINWLPYSAALSAIGNDPSPDQLGRPLGLIWFFAVSAALVGVGLVADRRRDS